jgi:NAD(P)H-flavin reductase
MHALIPNVYLRRHDIVLIGGGTGVAPFAQLLTLGLDSIAGPAIFGASTRVRFTLLLSNHTEADILWRDHIDEARSMFPLTVRTLYTLTSQVSRVRHSVDIFGQLLLFCDQSTGAAGELAAATCLRQARPSHAFTFSADHI